MSFWRPRTLLGPAAVEQLEIRGQRVSWVPVIKQKTGSDPAAVVFDGLSAALSRGIDKVYIDTAGRLHTKVNLMEELKKVRRTADKQIPGAPHEVFLVLDATTGQNAISQARLFHEAIGITGIIMTKLDGTAKGGVAVGIVQKTGLPLKFIGVGEQMDDLRPFDPETYLRSYSRLTFFNNVAATEERKTTDFMTSNVNELGEHPRMIHFAFSIGCRRCSSPPVF